MEAASAAAFGLVLAACAGLRAFLPVFGASLAIRTMGLEVPPSLEWMASTTSIIIFGVATVLEVLGDKIPVVDHLLDTVQAFTKPGLAVLAAIPFVHQLAPEHSVALAIIAGAPLAVGVHTAKASARVGSTAFTGGLANPLISLVEDVAAVVLIILGLIAPILALLLAVALLWKLVSYARKMARRCAASRSHIVIRMACVRFRRATVPTWGRRGTAWAGSLLVHLLARPSTP